MSLTKAERETIVRFSDDTEDQMTVFTHNKRRADALIKAGGVLKSTSKDDGVVVAWTVLCSRQWFRWPKPKVKRVLSPEQIAKSSARLSQNRILREKAQQ